MGTPLTEAQINALIAQRLSAAFAGYVKQSTMFDLLEVVTPGVVPGGAVADKSGLRFFHEYKGNDSATSYTPGGTLPVADAVKRVALSQNWGKYTAAFELNYLDWVKLTTGAADEYLVEDEIGRQSRALREAIIDAVETDIMTGTGADKVQGLASLISDSGSIYGQSRSSYPTLACYKAGNSGSGRALSKLILDGFFSTCRNTYKALLGPRITAWTSTSQKAAAAGLTGSSQATTVIADGAVPTLQIAADKVKYGNAEFVDVPGCTSGTIYFTDAAGHKLVALPGPNGDMWHTMPAERRGDIMRFEVYLFIQQLIQNPRKDAAFINDLT